MDDVFKKSAGSFANLRAGAGALATAAGSVATAFAAVAVGAAAFVAGIVTVIAEGIAAAFEQMRLVISDGDDLQPEVVRPAVAWSVAA